MSLILKNGKMSLWRRCRPVTEKAASIIEDDNGKEIEDKIEHVQELSVTNTASESHETCKLCCESSS